MLELQDVSPWQTPPPQPSAPQRQPSPPQHRSSLFPRRRGTRSAGAVTAALLALLRSPEGRTLLHEGRLGPVLGNGHGKPGSDAWTRATLLPKPVATVARLQTPGAGLVLPRGEEAAQQPLPRKPAEINAGWLLSPHTICV